MGKKIKLIQKMFLELIPVFIMLFFVYVFHANNLLISVSILAVIIISLLLKFKKHEFMIMLIGTPIMIMIEYFMVKFGAESFSNPVMFGLPLWIPFIWAYGLVAFNRIFLSWEKL